MQKRIVRLVLASVLFLLLYAPAQAQCSDRYLQMIFPRVDSAQDIIYTRTAGDSAISLQLDVFTPHSDTASTRKLIIWMHGGAFFQGSKADNDMKYLCYRFAQRGYVCASINYRLAPSVISLYDSLQDFKYMVWAMSDMKAAIRYFKQEYSTTNSWKIDTNHIYIGGTSAGAIGSDFAALLDSEALLPPTFRAIIDSNGGIEGNSGNPGFATHPSAVASLAGAINDLNWIHPGSPLTILSQGTSDRIVPYNCSYAFSGYTGGFLPTIRLCGSGEMAPAFSAADVRYSLQSFPGADHVPWNNDPVIAYSMDSAVATFFYTLECQLPLGITDQQIEQEIEVFPNPSTSILHVKSPTTINRLQLQDMTGRDILSLTPNVAQTPFHVENLPEDIYLLKIETEHYTFTRKISIQ